MKFRLTQSFLLIAALLCLLPPTAADASGRPGHLSEVDRVSLRVELSTGVDMHYVALPSPPRHDRAILLLHGYTDSWRSFTEMLALMPLERFRAPVYALDMRGHGESSAAPDDSYTQDDFSADIAAFMDALRIRKAVLVGHSMGSLIAHKFALDHPEKTLALVLLGSGPTLADHPVIDELEPIISTFPDGDPADPEFVEAFQTSTFFNPVEPWVTFRYVSESLRLRGLVWKETLAGLDAEDHVAQLPLISAPTLILWGDQDGIFSFAEQQILDTLIPDSTLLVYPQTGHAINVEQAAQVVEDVEDFLDARFP